MAAINEEASPARKFAFQRIGSNIRAAQLRVTLDEFRGRKTPEAVVRLAQLTPPRLPSPFETLRTPDGKLRTDSASRRQMALHVRRTIHAAQLRVALDEARGTGPADARGREAIGREEASDTGVVFRRLTWGEVGDYVTRGLAAGFLMARSLRRVSLPISVSCQYLFRSATPRGFVP